MNVNLQKLQPYPFEKLSILKRESASLSVKPHIDLSVGEPKHSPPYFVTWELVNTLDTIASYPQINGLSSLRQSIARWATKRFSLQQDSLDYQKNVLPVNGTREALFSFVQQLINKSSDDEQLPVVILPNPFYQIYEGAALMAGAEPYYVSNISDDDFLPDIDSIPEQIWERCQLFFLCSPGNPTGDVVPFHILKKLIEFSDKYNFTIASDECYSEIYFHDDIAPIGLLEASAILGRNDYKRCMVFHSLSKRSNLPGLRSGFVAGDARLIQAFLRYRTYHGCSMPVYAQHASKRAWDDELHVIENRKNYTEKFDAVISILSPVMDVTRPDAGFYLWLKTPVAGDIFAQDLFEKHNVTVLPGAYLGRTVNGSNPGDDYVRIALVAPLAECIDAARRMNECVVSFSPSVSLAEFSETNVVTDLSE